MIEKTIILAIEKYFSKKDGEMHNGHISSHQLTFSNYEYEMMDHSYTGVI